MIYCYRNNLLDTWWLQAGQILFFVQEMQNWRSANLPGREQHIKLIKWKNETNCEKVFKSFFFFLFPEQSSLGLHPGLMINVYTLLSSILLTGTLRLTTKMLWNLLFSAIVKALKHLSYLSEPFSDSIVTKVTCFCDAMELDWASKARNWNCLLSKIVPIISRYYQEDGGI